MWKNTGRLVLIAFAAASAAVSAGQPGQAESLLQAARNKAIVEGKLAEAIELYRDVLAKYEQDRPVAARALAALGQCYEKLGAAQTAEARKAYERIIRDYPEQKDLVGEAHARLAALAARSGEAGTSMLSVRKLWPSMEPSGKVSPDGRFVSFADWSAGGHLAIRDVATGEQRRLTDIGGQARPDGYAEYSVPSPDSRLIAFAWVGNAGRTYDLSVIGIDGTKPRVLRSAGNGVNRQFPLAWTPDGRHLLVESVKTDGTRDMMLVALADGSAKLLKAVGKDPSPGGAFSPDGRFIAWSTPEGIALFDVQSATETPLIPDRSPHSVLGWSPDGRHILFSSERSGSGDAWIVAVAGGKAVGEPAFVKKNWGFLPLGITRSGAFFYAVNATVGSVRIAELDPATGTVVSPPQPASTRANTWAPAWSPDGRSLAYIAAREPNWFVVVRSLATGDEREFPLGERSLELGASLRWFPDGKSIALPAFEPGKGDSLVRLDVETGRISHLMSLPSGVGFPRFGISRDGDAILRQVGSRTIARDLKTGQERVVFEKEGFYSRVLSPDGRRVVVAVREGKTQVLLVMRADGTESRELVRIDPEKDLQFGGGPWWTPDGRYIFFIKGVKGAPMQWQLWRIAPEGGEPQRLGLTIPGRLMGSPQPHPDGRRLAMSSVEPRIEVWVMENFLPKPAPKS